MLSPVFVPQARRQATRTLGVHRLFHVAPEQVLKGLQEVALPMDEMQHATDLDLPELFKEGMVHRLLAAGILQGPVDLRGRVG